MSARWRRLPAYPLYVGLNAASWCFQLMAFPMLSVYYLTVVGMSPLQLAIVGAVLQATVLLGEVPTGVVADTYSRRLSVVLGVLLTGAGFALEGALPRFEVILLAQVVRGLGQTFLSGALTAWITDEVGEAQASAALLRGAQAGQLGGLAGNGLSAGLASIYVGLPILLGGVLLMGLAVVLAAAMPEQGFRPAARDPHPAAALAGTLRAGLGVVRAQPALLTVLGVALFWGIFGEGIDRFWEAHFLRGYAFPPLAGLQPVAWFSLFNLGAMLGSLAAVEATTRWLRRGGHQPLGPLLGVSTGLTSAAVLIFGLTGDFSVALAAFWASVLFSAATTPLTEIWLNRRLPAAVRATGLSLRGQVAAAGQLAGGLLLGVLATRVSVAAAIVAAAVALWPALAWLVGARAAEPPADAR